jgi:hypothetical protein
VDASEVQVAQRYLHKPLTIDGFKFDLRIYTLVLSVDPLRILLYHEGLTRICTEKYVEPNNKNLSKSCVHLTNYAINKHNENFVQNDGDGSSGSKRSLQWFREWLDEEGHDSGAVWSGIADMIVKTLISVQPSLKHIYNSCSPDDNDGFSCFEVLGFDVMLDRKLQPWLIEVNHSPSFSCDSALDQQIKEALINDVMTVINVNPYDKKRHRAKMQVEAQQRLYGGKKQAGKTAADATAAEEEEQKTISKQAKAEKKCAETFEMIYPTESSVDTDRYNRLLDAAQATFEDTTSAPRGIRRMKQIGKKIQQNLREGVDMGGKGIDMRGGGGASTPTSVDGPSDMATADGGSAGGAGTSPKKTAQQLQMQQQVATAVKKMQQSIAEEGRRREEEEELNRGSDLGSNNRARSRGDGSERMGQGLPQQGAPAVSMRKGIGKHSFNSSGVRKNPNKQRASNVSGKVPIRGAGTE